MSVLSNEAGGKRKGSRSRGVQGSSDPPQNRRIKILKNYRRLNIRQKSHAPWLHIYKETKTFFMHEAIRVYLQDHKIRGIRTMEYRMSICGIPLYCIWFQSLNWKP